MTVASISQSVFNGYTSITRNMYLTSSIGITAMIFSNRFTHFEKIIKILSLWIILYSIFYGLKSTHDLNQYLVLLNKQNDLSELTQMQIKQWTEWGYFNYIYICIMVILCLVIFFRKIL